MGITKRQKHKIKRARGASPATLVSQLNFDHLNAASSFITFKLRPEVLSKFGVSNAQKVAEARGILNEEAAKRATYPSVVNLISGTESLDSPHATPIIPDPTTTLQPSDMKTRGAWDKNRANPDRLTLGAADINSNVAGNRASTKRKRDHTSRESSTPVDDVLVPRGIKKRRVNISESVACPLSPSLSVDESVHDVDSSSLSIESVNPSDKENAGVMEKPNLKLKLNFAKPAQPPSASSPAVATPGATPTPKLKLKFGGTKDNSGNGSAKKRKREDDKDGTASATPLSGKPKITFRAPSVKSAVQTPITPGVKLSAKGKVPKRHMGVGYDSELSESEKDPVILEGIILRMLPGPDCDYIKESISKGIMGISKLQGGADVGIRVFDDKGRRCILTVRQNKYAATLVDLPTIIEGMKSWDNKRFIKSVDICQMMLVLGPIKTDDEAKTFPLPEGVNPKTYSYAHGLTAPMQWVRKRRFDRTRRTRAEDIEAIDRRVGQLLAADAAASSVKYEVLDHDPRLDEDQYSETDSDEEEDAEGEEDDYFGGQPLGYDTPAAEDVGEDEILEFTEMLGGDDEDANMGDSSHIAANGHVDSSGFVTSAADSPDVTNSAVPTAAPTPAGDASTPAAGTDAGDDSDDDEDQDDREEQNEQDEQKSAIKERISDLEKKIAEQMGTLKNTQNAILRRRIAAKIKDLQKDVDMLKRELGEGDDEGDGDDGDDE